MPNKYSDFLESIKTNKDVLLKWSDVNKIHRSRNGIYQQNGSLISLLTDFGRISKCYPDITNADQNVIFYTGAGRRGDQKLDVYNTALNDAIISGHSVPLFCKLDVNKWKYMDKWQVVDSEYVFEEKNERKVWRFTLRRAN